MDDQNLFPASPQLGGEMCRCWMLAFFRWVNFCGEGALKMTYQKDKSVEDRAFVRIGGMSPAFPPRQSEVEDADDKSSTVRPAAIKDKGNIRVGGMSPSF
jgi:hypothetical protein